MNSDLKILLHGNMERLRLGASFKRAFENLGHNVVPFDLRKRDKHLTWWLTNRAGKKLTEQNLRMRRWGSTEWRDLFLNTARREQPDLAFILEGEYLMPETIRSLQHFCRCVVGFNADNPFPGNPSSRPEHIPASKEMDGYFIWSRALKRRLTKQGVSDVRYLPFAWDPEVFPSRPINLEPEHDVVFIGNWCPKREEWLEPVAEHFDLRIWGAWWDRSSWGSALRDSWREKQIHGKEASKVVANTKICLNVMRDHNLPDGTNMRTFEVPGAGGFLLSTWSEGADAIFPEGEAGAYFRSVDEMLDQIRYYLDRGQERQEIAQRAHAIAKKNTYTERVEKIIEDQVCTKFEKM